MRARDFALGALLLIAATAAAVAEDAKADLDGTWSLVSVERSGRGIRPQNDTKMIITGEKFVVKTGDTTTVAGTLKLDASKKPKTIDITYTEGADKDQAFKGIYEVDGETLRLCRAGSADGERPGELKSKRGSGELSFTYKRAK